MSEKLIHKGMLNVCVKSVPVRKGTKETQSRKQKRETEKEREKLWEVDNEREEKRRRDRGKRR